MTEVLLQLIVVIVVLILIGALVSLPALLPPLRKLCRRSPAARIATICMLGLAALVVTFGLYTRLEAEVFYIFGARFVIDTFDPEIGAIPAELPEYQANKPLVIRELWLHLLSPPPLRQPCYTTEMVCDLVRGLTPDPSTTWSWPAYFLRIGISLVPALTSAVLVWIFTRPGGVK